MNRIVTLWQVFRGILCGGAEVDGVHPSIRNSCGSGWDGDRYFLAAVSWLSALFFGLIWCVESVRGEENQNLDAENTMAVARAAFDDGLFSIALSRIETLLSVDREEIEPRMFIDAVDLLFDLLERRERFEEMLVRLDALSPRLANLDAAGLPELWRAAALAGLGHGDEALETIDRVRENEAVSGERRGRLLRLYAGILLDMDRKNEALDIFRQLDELLDTDAAKLRNRLDRARVLDEIGSHEQCAELLDGFPADGVSDELFTEAVLLESSALEALGRLNEAREKLRENLPRMQDLNVAGRGLLQLRLAELQLESNDFAMAEESLASARRNLRDLPVKTPEMRWMGRVMLRLDSTRDEGIALLKERMRAAPSGIDTGEDQLEIADALRLAGKYERAAREYQVFLESFKRPELECRAFWGRALALFALENFDESVVWFERVHALCEDEEIRVQCLYKAGDALAAAGRFAAAAQRYRRVVDDYPASPLAPAAGVSAAECFLRAKIINAAEELLRRVMDRYPDSPEMLDAGLRLGELLADRGRADEAIETLDQVIEMARDDRPLARALLARGRVHYRALRAQAALSDFDRVLQLDSELEAEALFLRANSLYWLWRDEEALDSCRRLLKNHPDDPLARDAQFWLGRYHYNRAQYREAREYFEMFEKRWSGEPWSDSALLWAARAAYSLDAFDEALTLLGRFFDKYPDSESLPAARFIQGEALTMQARFDEALLAFDTILLRNEMSDWVVSAWGRKGDCLFTLGKDNPARYEQSIEAYRNVTGSPDASLGEILQAEFKIGRSLEKLNRADEAIEQYYARVIVRFIEERSRGVWHDEASRAWFTRAVFHSADLLEARGEGSQAARLLGRIIQVGAPGRDEARRRIQRIERESLWSVSGGAVPSP